MSRVWLGLLPVVFVACVGCASSPRTKADGTPIPGKVERKVLKQASFELQCDEAQLEIIKLSRDFRFMGVENATYGVRGCGRQATYKTSCGHGACSVFNMAQMQMIQPAE